VSIPAIVLIGAEHPDALRAGFARYEQEYDVRLGRTCREALEATHDVVAGGGTVAMFASESRVPDAETVLHAFHKLREKVPTARRVVAAHWDRFMTDGPVLRSGMSTGKYDAYLLMPRGIRDEEFHNAITDLLSDWGSTVADPEVVAVKIVSPERDALTLGIRDFLDRMGMPNLTSTPDSAEGAAALALLPAEPAFPLVYALNRPVIWARTVRDVALGIYGAPTDNNAALFKEGQDRVLKPLIERGDIEYALVVDGETSNVITENTIERLLQPDVTEDQFRNEFASLTLGSGAAAMVLGRAELLPDGHRFLGSVTRAATQFSHLCRGNLDRMVTDTRTLLVEGLKLAAKTFQAARAALGWASGELDEFVVHQISKVHTAAFTELLGIDPRKVLTVFPEFGNVGPASVPIALSKLKEMGRLEKGKRVALLGIGSGLNCSMAEVVW